jgi:hypothetical protein
MTISIAKNVTTALMPRGTHIVIGSIGGVGKTTFGATATKAEKGLMLLTGEDGLSPLNITDVPHIPIGCNVNSDNIDEVASAYSDYLDVLKQLITEKHEYRLIVQDPLSSLISSCFESYVVKKYYNGDFNKANAYGAKYQEYQTEFNKLIESYKIILNKGINIITTCHCNPIDYKDPSTESYKKWELTLPLGNKVNLAATLFNHADAVFFGCYEVTVKDHKATGGVKRILRTAPSASYTVKNMRLPNGQSLPDPILFDYSIFKTLSQKKG